MTDDELLPIDAYLSQFTYTAPERIVGAARFVYQLRAEVERLQPFEQDADELAEAGAKRIDVMLDLLVAYRTGGRPSERTLNNIPRAERRWKAALAAHDKLVKGETDETVD